MNRMRIVLGSVASLGLAVAVACGSSSSGNGAGNGDAGGSGSSSGASSSGTSSGSSGSGSSGTMCPSGQTLCVGLGTSCVDAGDTCVGTTVVASECSATQACPGSQVCCSSYVGSDGGVIVVDVDAAVADDAALPTTFAGLGAVAVQCLSQCPAGALSSQVCSLDDGGTGSACPQGTTCRALLPAFLASASVPNTLCLAPLPDAGAFVRPDGGFVRPTADAGVDAGDTTTDAAPE